MVGGLAAAQGGREVLPTNVKPTHYDLTLEPDLLKFTYQGTVKIEYGAPQTDDCRLSTSADTMPVLMSPTIAQTLP